MKISRLTSKNQITLPLSIRNKLHVHAGDRVEFVIEGDGKVVVKKPEPIDWAYLKSIESGLSEWSSEEDEEAYRDL
jgi:antitoxin PrlF